MERRKSIDRVLIVGGTHGNELIGAYLIQYLEQHPASVIRESFSTHTLLANPLAFAQGRRYVDHDLNRSFHIQALQDPMRSGYEASLAKQIVANFGKSGTTPIDVIIDLHSTTSHMGLTIIIDENPFNLKLATYLQQVNPEINIYCLPRKREDANSLPSICEWNCTIEVGAVAQGVLNAQLFQETQELIQLILNYLDDYNKEQFLEKSQPLTLYRHIGKVDYPRSESGNLLAMIHPNLQFQDYVALHPGDPIFLTFQGQIITYNGESTVYPVFINEAAYYEKGIAFCLTQKEVIQFETLDYSVDYSADQNAILKELIPDSLQLTNWVQKVHQFRPGSPERQRALTEIIRFISRSGKIWRDEKIPLEYYQEALHRTWLWFSKNLERCDPNKGSLIAEFNNYLRFQIRRIEQEMEIKESS